MLSNFFTGFFQSTVHKELQDTAHEAAQVLDSSVSSQLTTVDNLSMPAQQGHDESPIVSTTPAATHAVISSSKSHHDNINMDNTAAGTISNNSFETFRSQIQRMRERYREKRNAIELQQNNEVLQLTTMYQTVVQSKKELEDRLLLDLKKKDAQLFEVCQHYVGCRYLNSLQRDVAGMPVLLQARELDIQNLKEQHRHDVRAVERQLDESHQRMTQSNDEVQRLQTSLLATQMELNTLKLDHETLLDMAKYVVADLEHQLTEYRHLQGVIESNIGIIANDSSTVMISKAMVDKEVENNIAEFTTETKPMLKVAEQGIPMPNMAHYTGTNDDDDDDHTATITTTHPAETRTTPNEDGQLTTRSGDIVDGDDADSYVSQKWDEYPILLSPTTAVISSSIRDQNINIDTADVTIPINLFENFSSQIKRLEGHYKEELEEIEQRNKNEIQQLTIMHHTCVQSKNELEDRLLSDLKEKEEKLVDVKCRRNEARRLKCYVLKREVARMQELVQSRELDFKKLQEKHLHDLRAIEKQSNVVEHRATQSKEEVERLQTALQATQMELTSLKQEHETLIGIAKYVASDLEDRRTECRHLQGVVNATNEKNHAIKA
jgi:hypothetical protein